MSRAALSTEEFIMAKQMQVEIYCSTKQVVDGLWYWRLRAANGEIIADGSEGYDSKGNAKKAVSRVKRHISVAPVVETGE